MCLSEKGLFGVVLLEQAPVSVAMRTREERMLKAVATNVPNWCP